MSRQRLFTLLVVFALIVIAALTIRAGLVTAELGNSIGARLIEMNQRDHLSNPDVPIVVYPRLINDEPAAQPLDGNDVPRK